MLCRPPTTWAVAGLLLTVAFALYANAIPNQFVFDDNSTFRRNEAIRGLDSLPGIWTSGALGYRPVRYLSFAIDYAVSGDEPWAYHVFNSLYHGLSALLVYLVLRRLTGEPRAALAGALVFVVHPVHTESVAYISGRRDILTTLFYLLGLLAYFRFRDSGAPRWAAACLAAFALALGSKEMAITLPAAIVLHDLVLDRAALRRHWPFYAVGGLAAGAAAVHTILGNASSQVGYHGGSLGATLLTSGRLAVHYARLLVLPTNLLADYSYDAFPISASLLEPRTLGAIALIAGALGAAAACRRRAPLVTFGILWFFLTLAPVSQVVPHHELAAEHYLYLPSVGFCLLAGLGVERLRARAGARTAYAVFGVALVALSARTVIRNLDWRTPETLHRATVATAPQCVRAKVNFASALASRGDLDGAASLLREAVAIDPGHVYGHFTLGRILERLGRPAEARPAYEEALRLARALPRSPVAPGAICIVLGRHAEGIIDFERELAQRPGDVRPYRGLAICHAALGDWRSAHRALERLLEGQPESLPILRSAAVAAKRAGDARRAAELRARLDALERPRRPAGR